MAPAAEIGLTPAWTLERRPDATAAQKEHFAAFLARTPADRHHQVDRRADRAREGIRARAYPA